MDSDPVKEFKLEKLLWTDADFDHMGWHDNKIHAIAFGQEEQELLFDIDYIFKWVDPKEGEQFYRFWLAPCTLVFSQVHQVRLNSDTGSMYDFGIPILELERRQIQLRQKHQTWEWSLLCLTGSIHFQACGYHQYVRAQPLFSEDQSLTVRDRGGFSFAKKTWK